jgi:hypothetical protein
MSREIWLKYWGSFEAPKYLGKNLGKYDDFLGKFEKIIWHHCFQREFGGLHATLFLSLSPFWKGVSAAAEQLSLVPSFLSFSSQVPSSLFCLCPVCVPLGPGKGTRDQEREEQGCARRRNGSAHSAALHGEETLAMEES